MARSSSQPRWGTHLTAWWPADPAAYGSARERRGGEYGPFVPPHIATWPFKLSAAAVAAVSQGADELQSLRADGGTPGGVHSLAETLLRSESVASSRIEGLQMTHARIARARHGGNEDDGFAELDGDRAVGLFGELAGFNDNLTCAQLGGYFFWHNNGS